MCLYAGAKYDSICLMSCYVKPMSPFMVPAQNASCDVKTARRAVTHARRPPTCWQYETKLASKNKQMNFSCIYMFMCIFSDMQATSIHYSGRLANATRLEATCLGALTYAFSFFGISLIFYVTSFVAHFKSTSAYNVHGMRFLEFTDISCTHIQKTLRSISMTLPYKQILKEMKRRTD